MAASPVSLVIALARQLGEIVKVEQTTGKGPETGTRWRAEGEGHLRAKQ